MFERTPSRCYYDTGRGIIGSVIRWERKGIRENEGKDMKAKYG
jgi:hypothetical protein